MTNSFRNRFLASLGGNAVRIAAGVAANLLIARSLAAREYGNLAFLLTTFVSIRSLVDLGTCNAFFTIVSQKPRTRYFYRFYFAILGLQLLLTVVPILILPRAIVDYVWVGLPVSQILLAFAATFMQLQVWQTINQIGDAVRQTIRVQCLNTVVLVGHIGVLTLLIACGWLSISRILWAIVLEYFVIAITGYRSLRRFVPLADPHDDDLNAFPKLFRIYKTYCVPLTPLAIVAFLADFGDRWLLQHFAGPTDQAYFSISTQVASVAALATVSIGRIFWKELAEAYANANLERTRTLFENATRNLFTVGALIAGLLIPWTQSGVAFALGERYAPAWMTIAVMLIYPIHQSIGQVGEIALLATSRTGMLALYRAAQTCLSLAAAYSVLAPRAGVIPGFGLGSFGLAVKMVVLNLVSSNFLAWLVCRTHGWPLRWRYQFTTLIPCLVIGYVAKQLASRIWSGGAAGFNIVPPMSCSALIYAVVIGIVALTMPQLLGLHRKQAEAR